MDYEALHRYAYDAADFSTGGKLPDLQFVENHSGQPDVAMFDFTCMYRAENASLVRERRGKKLLMCLVGDCLVEVGGDTCDPSSLYSPVDALCARPDADDSRRTSSITSISQQGALLCKVLKRDSQELSCKKESARILPPYAAGSDE